MTLKADKKLNSSPKSSLGLFIAWDTDIDLPLRTKDIRLMKTRTDLLAEQPFSLSLSSGFFGYFAHVGFALALEDKGLKPASLSGSSAGALVAAGLASGRSASELKEIFLSIRKSDFWDPAWGWGFLKGKKIEELLGQYCVSNFTDTHIPLHISAFNINKQKTKVFTSGLIAPACRASAAVPVLFHPVQIEGEYFWDGGIRDRAGVQGVQSSSLTPVIHYLHAQGLVSRIEDKYFYAKLHKNPFFFKRPSPHKMGPESLDKGKDVLELFHRQTQQWLEEKI